MSYPFFLLKSRRSSTTPQAETQLEGESLLMVDGQTQYGCLPKHILRRRLSLDGPDVVTARQFLQANSGTCTSPCRVHAMRTSRMIMILRNWLFIAPIVQGRWQIRRPSTSYHRIHWCWISYLSFSIVSFRVWPKSPMKEVAGQNLPSSLPFYSNGDISTTSW